MNEEKIDKKIKVLVLSDHPLSPSGVGTQTKYMIESLLSTGKFSFICLGGAVKHHDYNPTKTQEWGDDWVIYPVDGYGSQDMIRSVMRNERPDILWFMTDPRFYAWLWDMEDEIRPHIPMVYYHVWDNKPYPMFNKPFYESTDVIAAISKVTADIVENVAPDVDSLYLPHSVDTEIFSKKSVEAIEKFKKENMPELNDDRFVFFWNNRNARRKQSGSLIFWFKDSLDVVGHDKARLVMHTDVRDEHGQNLQAIIEHLGLVNGEVMFSQSKIPPEMLSMIYNISDCVVNISDAGEGIEPSSKAIIGSQPIPWIYEDRISGKDLVDAMLKIYNMTPEERAETGAAGRQHVVNNYNFENYKNNWESLMLRIHEEYGSWENRKGYKKYELIEVS